MSLLPRLDKILIHWSTITFALGIVLIGPFLSIQRTDNIVTFSGFVLMLLILKAQSRSEHAILIKLDELIRAIETADNKYIGIEEKENL